MLRELARMFILITTLHGTDITIVGRIRRSTDYEVFDREIRSNHRRPDYLREETCRAFAAKAIELEVIHTLHRSRYLTNRRSIHRS